MKKKIKSAVISIAVIAVLLLSILIGVKNGTLDKLTKEMPTLATSQEETEKTTVNVKNDSTESKPYEGIENSCKNHCICPPGTKRKCTIRNQIPGSVSFVPSVAGMIIAGEVIKDVIELN